MINYEDFIKLYPDEETIRGKSFEKDFPVGTKFLWSDRQKYTIVSYFYDKQFRQKKNEGLRFDHMVVFKTWSKYGQRWMYQVYNTYIFYCVWEMMKREEEADRKWKKEHEK